MGTKIVVSVGVLVLAIAGAAPWVDGYIFRQHYSESLKSIQSPRVKVSILDYHEGWLSSDAKISFELPADMSVPNSPSPSYRFVVDGHITHGPVVFNPITQRWALAQGIVQFNFHLPSDIETLILGASAANGIMQVATVATFDGNYHSAFTMPVINRSMAGTNLHWDGLTGNSDVLLADNKLSHILADVSIGTLTADGSMIKLTMQPISIKYDLTPDISNLLWNGTYNLALPRLTASLQGKNVDLTNFQFSDLSTVAGANYSNKMQFSLGQFVIPEYSITNSNLNCSFQNINAPAMSALIKQMGNYEGGSMTSEQYNQYLSYLPPLIATTTNVVCDSTINTSFGKSVTTATVNWPDAVKTVDDINKNISVKLDARVSVSLVNKVIDIMNEKDSEQEAASAPAPDTSNQPTDENLLAKIDAWVKQGAIAVDVGEQLKDLEQTHIPPASFAQNINAFVVRKDITQDIAGQLIAAYQAVDNARKHPTLIASPQPVKQLSPADLMKQQIDASVKAGFITLDKDDYVTTITFDKGVMKANGHELQATNPNVNAN